MKDRVKRYSRKPKVRFRDIFKKNKTITGPLEEKINEPKREIKGWPLIFGYLGIFMIVIGIVDLIPLICMCFFPYEFNRCLAFIIPGVLSIGIGVCLAMLLKGKDKARLGKYQDLVLLILIWIVACLVGAVPFMLPDYVGSFRIGGLGLDYVHAIFETVSGFTTTGFSILEGSISPSSLLTSDGHCFLFFRAVLCFFGGIGFVLVLTCIVSDNYGIRLYYSEGHTDRLLPNLYKSAKLIFGLYAGLVLLGSIALWLGGMNEWTVIDTPAECAGDPTTSSYFEALCMSMTHVPSAGFATRNYSVYAYNSVTIEIIFEIIMLFGGTNFLIIFYMCKFQWKKVIKDLDVRLQLSIAAITIPILVIISSFTPAYDGGILSFGENVRYNLFYFISAATTTGAGNAASIYNTFSTPTVFILTIIMAFGGQQGSTAGGIKLYRVGIVFKSIYWTLKEKNSSSNIIYPHYTYKYGEFRQVSDKEVKDCTTYFFLHFMLIFLVAILISLGTYTKFDFAKCLFEASSALAGTGLSAGIISYSLNAFTLTVVTIAMFIGRLEIYTFIFASKKLWHDVVKLVKTKVLHQRYVE